MKNAYFEEILETYIIYNMEVFTGLSVGKAEWIPLFYWQLLKVTCNIC
jgi:hypothetical protein